MLIKSVAKTSTKKGPKKGTAIPYSHDEAALFAVERGVKGMNSKEKIFWVLRKSIKVSVTGANSEKDGNYRATASGTALVGYTDVATDEFHSPKLCNIDISWKSVKDRMGLPDIEITEFEAIEAAKSSRDAAFYPRKKKEEPKKEAPAPKPEAPKVEQMKKEEPKKAEEKKA
jgi:hypothetical protein